MGHVSETTMIALHLFQRPWESDSCYHQVCGWLAVYNRWVVRTVGNQTVFVNKGCKETPRNWGPPNLKLLYGVNWSARRGLYLSRNASTANNGKVGNCYMIPFWISPSIYCLNFLSTMNFGFPNSHLSPKGPLGSRMRKVVSPYKNWLAPESCISGCSTKNFSSNKSFPIEDAYLQHNHAFLRD